MLLLLCCMLHSAVVAVDTVTTGDVIDNHNVEVAGDEIVVVDTENVRRFQLRFVFELLLREVTLLY